MLKKIVFVLLYTVFWYVQVFSMKSHDSLDAIYSNSKNYQIIEDSSKVSAWWVKWWVQDTVKIMLKIAIIIWMAVFLYGWIRFLLSMWDDSKAKKVRDTLITSGVWLIIAFWSWAILQLVISLWRTIAISP